MDKVATMAANTRADLFRETAARRRLPPGLVEKDFWVCWVLKHLFSIDAFVGHLLFKGGTTLSKVFHLTERFSEDIDLAVDWEMLGFVGTRSPHAEMSKSKQAKLLVECQKYIAGEFIDTVQQRVASILGDSGSTATSWELSIDSDDPHSVHFRYPSVVEQLGYLKASVVLELGTHAEFIPHDRYTIRPLAVDEFTNMFDEPNCRVLAITAERSFWEKATILHQEFHRPKDKPVPGGYSRHYYDVAMMGRADVKQWALADMELLARVVSHKEQFYPRRWARYDLAVAGSFCLLPSNVCADAIRRDYEEMKVMIFGEAPSFDEILATLKELEKAVNQ
ncbi:MAG: hypothetical protein CMJ64_12565 [Planctomycetaceae bacterium]|nr:hypothetical protein [Planctomycetaceae bacterium]